MYHYYTNSFARRLQMGLRGGRPGCPPRLFETGQLGQQPPRLIINRGGQRKKPPINRGGHLKKTASVNAY